MQYRGPVEFEARADGLYRLQNVDRMTSTIRLTNFVATIVADITCQNTDDKRRWYRLLCKTDHEETFEIEVAEFEKMKWVGKYLGPNANIYSGFQGEQRTKDAILANSHGRFVREVVITQMGWQKINGNEAYVHAGGVIHAQPETPLTPCELKNSKEPNLQIKLDLFAQKYRLPDKPTDKALIKCGLAMRCFKDAVNGKRWIMIIGYICYALHGHPDFQLFLYGPSGSFKSAIGEIIQSFFCCDSTEVDTLTSWSSTPAGIEAILGQLNNTLLVLDDYVAEGSASDKSRTRDKAARISRTVGNRSARQRCNTDSTLQQPKAPSVGLFSTGEELPHGNSILARMVGLPISRQSIPVKSLTQAQKGASLNLYAKFTCDFIHWLGNDRDRAQTTLAERIRFSREENHAGRSLHPRLADAVGKILGGTALYNAYLHDRKLTNIFPEVHGQANKVITDIVLEHDNLTNPELPYETYIETIRSAYVVDEVRIDQIPDSNSSENCTVKSDGEDVPTAPLIGWKKGSHYLIDPLTAYAIVVERQKKLGIVFDTPMKTVHKQLLDANYILPTGNSRNSFLVRRKIYGVQHNVLRFDADKFRLVGKEEPNEDPNANFAARNPENAEADAANDEGTIHEVKVEPIQDEEDDEEREVDAEEGMLILNDSPPQPVVMTPELLEHVHVESKCSDDPDLNKLLE